MSDVNEVISSNDDLKKYRYETPNIIDDLDLSPHAFRIYSHYRRACGANGKPCTQSTKTIAAICSMSTGKVSEAKKELADMGLIQIVETTSKVGVQHNVTVTNIWSINFAYFDKQITLEVARQRIWEVVHNMNEGVQDMNDPRSQYELKKEHIIQERTIEETIPPATQNGKSDSNPLLADPLKTQLYTVFLLHSFNLAYESLTTAERKSNFGRFQAVAKALRPLHTDAPITAPELTAAYRQWRKENPRATALKSATKIAEMLTSFRATQRKPARLLQTPAIDRMMYQVDVTDVRIIHEENQ